MMGGVSVQPATRHLREPIFQLSGFAVKALYANGLEAAETFLSKICPHVSRHYSREETEVVRANSSGTALPSIKAVRNFSTITILGGSRSRVKGLEWKGEKILVGLWYPRRRTARVPFDIIVLLYTDGRLGRGLGRNPKRKLLWVGAGVVGLRIRIVHRGLTGCWISLLIDQSASRSGVLEIGKIRRKRSSTICANSSDFPLRGKKVARLGLTQERGFCFLPILVSGKKVQR